MAQRDFEINYEQALLANVPLCYSVALALTHNPGDALSLARDAVIAVWQTRNAADNPTFVKRKLLTIMRQTFQQRIQQIERN